MSSIDPIADLNGNSGSNSFTALTKPRHLIYVVTAVIVVLLAVLGLSIATLIKERQRNESQNPTAAPTRQQQYVGALIDVTKNYSTDLTNPSSQHFQSLAAMYSSQILDSFSSSAYNQYKVAVAVNQFEQPSSAVKSTFVDTMGLKVDFTLTFTAASSVVTFPEPTAIAASMNITGQPQGWSVQSIVLIISTTTPVTTTTPTKTTTTTISTTITTTTTIVTTTTTATTNTPTSTITTTTLTSTTTTTTLTSTTTTTTTTLTSTTTTTTTTLTSTTTTTTTTTGATSTIATSTTASTSTVPTTTAAPDISALLMQAFKPENIETNLQALCSKLHRAGTQASLDTSDWIAQQYRNFGLDMVEQPEYQVLLSYPNDTDTNKIWLVASNGTEELASNGLSEYLAPGDNASEYANVLFNGFGAAGNVTGDLVYVNYGRFEDYQSLQRMGISLLGKIAIARYGQIWRGAKAQFAQQLGAIGVIIYMDPIDYSNNYTDYADTFPNSLYMPPRGAQRGAVTYGIANGDFPTPFLPAKNYTYRIPTEQLQAQLVLPRIPITPIGYEDAAKLLAKMNGSMAPVDWQGRLPGVREYRLGPLLNGMQVHLKVNNYLDTRTIRNTIGYIKGAVEPEKYVVVGNHHDAWVYGAMDPNSGTAVVIETARVFKQVMNATGWRPRRTVLFCHWDSEEYGLHGSDEWVEDNMRRLEDRAIAYLNLDSALGGNDTLYGAGVPLLQTLLFDSAKMTPNPNADEYANGRPTVYDTYKYQLPNDDGSAPDYLLLGSGSDFAWFQDYIGIPSIDFGYQGLWPDDYPLYHTIYETPWTVGNLLDRGFNYSRAVGQLLGEMIRSLADSPVLPLDALNYAKNVQQYVNDLVNGVNGNLSEIMDAKQNLLSKANDFVQSAQTLNDSIAAVLNSNNTIQIRTLNEKLQYLERMFIIPKGLPQYPQNRHVVFSPSTTNTYAGTIFPGIADSISNIMPPQINFLEQPMDSCNYNWTETLKEQLSWISYCIDQAADWLRRDF